MKGHLTILFLLGLLSSEAFGCPTCMPAKDSPTAAHMAVAIWVLMGVVMSVMGGVGAFSFHLWKHANTPLEPHQQLTDEDLKPYE